MLKFALSVGFVTMAVCARCWAESNSAAHKEESALQIVARECVSQAPVNS